MVVYSGLYRQLQSPQRSEHSVPATNTLNLLPPPPPCLPWFAAKIFRIVHSAVMKTNRAEEFHSSPGSGLKMARERDYLEAGRG